ncbi:polysaccharide biosynthesis C-terminal domain-containing protein [bacterium]|nr:polysaccharide biosynthesis C-terminal domain-containing protein [bacterium]
MKAQFKRLTSDSAVYGVSNVLGRFITFLLVPFYSHTLPQGDYGIVVTVYSAIAFLNAACTFGLEPAYMRFIAGKDDAARNRIFTSSMRFIAVASLLVSAVVLLFQQPARVFLEISPANSPIIPLSLAMIVLDAVNVIPLAALRMEQRARMFAFVRITSIVINVGLNVLFIYFLHWSIVWIFVSGAIASFSTTVLLLPVFISHSGRNTEKGLLRELLHYGLPTMPGAVAIMLVEVIDKPLMLKLTDAATAGVYSMNYKLGIFMMLVVTVFRYAWQPLYLQMTNSDETRRFFARVLTYFVLLSSAIVLLLTLFIGDIVRISIPLLDRNLIKESYLGGLGIVPIILFSYLWAGVAQILNAGLYIEKRTRIILYATTAGAVVNIITNLLLIPVWGMYGGAVATFAAYATISGVYAAAVRRIFPVRWEYGRLLRIAVALTAGACLWYLVPPPAQISFALWRIVIFLTFTAVIFLSGFFLRSELQSLRRFLFRRAD